MDGRSIVFIMKPNRIEVEAYLKFVRTRVVVCVCIRYLLKLRLTSNLSFNIPLLRYSLPFETWMICVNIFFFIVSLIVSCTTNAIYLFNILKNIGRSDTSLKFEVLVFGSLLSVYMTRILFCIPDIISWVYLDSKRVY